ncbi:uncharacterized protein LOC124685876 [Lolium rigidum]|uniref:uncharacterized protein LOC124685876 n=1 Tax=Lolium rigidum TaxID=89674 RepID=UPI001F5C56F2|nr:uncharacterized protein LOC124685876 [Lolium rigidum]
MAAAVSSSSPCCSATPLPSSSSSSCPLFLPRPSRLRHQHLLLPIRSRPGPIRSTSTSYNGWADLPAADPDPAFLRIAAGPNAPLLLLLLPAVAALSLSRLPPIPLLAATFAAGFATARHLSPTPAPSHHHHRLPALLADLDARLLSFKDRLLSATNPNNDEGIALQSLDRARDAVLDCAAAVYGGTNASGAAPEGDALRDVAREVAGYFGTWAKDALRELSFTSPRKKPAVPKVVAPAAAASAAAVADSKSGSDAAGVAHAQQGDGDKHTGSIRGGAKRAGIGEDRPSGSTVVGTARPLDMLPFDGQDADDGADDAGLSSESGQEDDRLERLVFKHRYGRSSSRRARADDPFAFEDGGGFAAESTESSLLERTLEIRDRSYRLKIERRNGAESRASGAHKTPADEFTASADEPALSENGAIGSDAEEFSRNVKEAAEVLRKARECMMARDDEEAADALLYRSASLLSTAVALRPTSLAAVGQLGNTYLLHGELKLKISRELRTLLANSGAYLSGRERVARSGKLDRRIMNRENISSALVDVCEECESLLVEAGRSYRMAVSIDSGDVKALYNWGLALTFRGQLLADIGPEAAVDADRVYLAAIDKFDAMLSKSNTYAPEALYRWGSTLQQRSQLRSRNNKEKIRLLEQAKSLFEDVLYVEGNNKMVREALSSCISELNYHGRWLQ